MAGYLLKFKKLNVLNLTGNDVCNEPDYKTYLIAHLPYLKYLDYTIISEHARAEAQQDLREEILEKKTNQDKEDNAE